MYKLTLTNDNGNQLTFNQLGGPFTITEITGLNPPTATINTNTTAIMDGARFNSSKVEMREIQLAFAIEYDAAANRLEVYKVIQSKKHISLEYESELIDVTADGYVESIDITYFAMKQIVTVSILCPFPYFKAAQTIVNDLSNLINLFSFPFASEGGKNLLPYPYYQSTRTNAGVTYTDNGDGTITCDGTSTSSTTTAFVMQSRDEGNFYLPPGNYILSGGISSTQRVVINYMQEGATTATTVAVSTGEDAAFTITEEIAAFPLQVGIYTTAGASWENETVYPMIRFSTYTDDTWQPYNYGEIVFGYVETVNNVTVTNGGTVEVGMTIELYAKAPVTNPKIYNYITNDFFGLDFSMQAADLITISTTAGNKTVTLLREGTETNIFNSITKGSTWLQLAVGGNEFVYTADSGGEDSLNVYMSHNDLYEGV